MSKKAINNTLIILLAIWSPLGAIGYLPYLVSWGASIKYILPPLLMILSCGYILFVGICPQKINIYIISLAILCALGLSLLGLLVDFTAVGESAPSPFEWINYNTFVPTVLFIGIVSWRLFEFKKTDA